MNIKDTPNIIKARLIVDIEGEFYDDEATEETLRYCVENYLEDAGFNVINVDAVNCKSNKTWILLGGEANGNDNL